MDTKTILAGLILSVAVASAILPSIDTGIYEYSFDPTMKIWTNAAGEQINMKALTCNYSKISETARTVKFGEYKESVFIQANQTLLLSVTGGASKTLSAYLISIDEKNKPVLKEVK